MSARCSALLLWFLLSFLFAEESHAKDYFLTIGGGYSPEGNQASLERNVLSFQQLLKEQHLDQFPHDIFFADGNARGKDLQVIDPSLVPKANQLMAEFFGSQEYLGLHYRNHQISGIRGANSPAGVRNWFEYAKTQFKSGDRLMIYVTSHGNRSNNRSDPYDTTIAMWNDTSLSMKEFTRLLDQLPNGVDVIAIMVQCYSGGFSRLIFTGGDPDNGLSKQRRCGFFATVHDRQAAGCTAEIDEASYVEYSTYFWSALAGHDRSGNPIEPPDYNRDGIVTFDEAHAYTILNAETIDLPVKTSGEYLNVYSVFGDDQMGLLSNEEPYEAIWELASESDRIVLDGLSEQLELTGSDRVVQAYNATQPNRGTGRGNAPQRSRGRRSPNRTAQLKRRIVADIEDRWPELANLLNPVAIELVTTRSAEFVRAIEEHPDYQRYRELAATEADRSNQEKRTVKYERFLRVADNIVLAENLHRMGNQEHIREFESIIKAESGSLGSVAK